MKKSICNISSKQFAISVVIKRILEVRECAIVSLLKLVLRLQDGSYVWEFFSKHLINPKTGVAN